MNRLLSHPSHPKLLRMTRDMIVVRRHSLSGRHPGSSIQHCSIQGGIVLRHFGSNRIPPLEGMTTTTTTSMMNHTSSQVPADSHRLTTRRRQRLRRLQENQHPHHQDLHQYQNHRYLTQSSKPSSGGQEETPSDDGTTMTLKDREEDDDNTTAISTVGMDPNEDSHPESSLEGADRSLYHIPVTIKMPDMGEGNQNTIEEWYKRPGDIIKRNDVLCDITTPDFTFGMVTDDEHDAIMGEILVEKGEQAPDDAPICIVYHPDNDKAKDKEEETTKQTTTNQEEDHQR